MADHKSLDLVSAVRRYLDAKDAHDREVKRCHGALASYQADPIEVALRLNETMGALERAEIVLREQISIREGGSNG